MGKANLGLIAAILFFTLANAGTALALGLPGSLDETGTHFEITDSQHFNFSLDSGEPIKVMIQAMPKTIFANIEPISEALSTTITVSGFTPLTTYYRYEDSFRNLTEFTTDEFGSHAYVQDLSETHLVIIQTYPGTLFIDDNATGGDCTLVGTWDAGSKTCTFTTDVTETIEIESDGITLDGGGQIFSTYIFANGKEEITITNIDTGDVHPGHDEIGLQIYNSSNITIKNNKFSNRWCALYLDNSNNSTIIGNTFNSNIVGILARYSNNILIKENSFLNSLPDTDPPFPHQGLYLRNSNNNQVYNNNFIDNDIQAEVLSSADNLFNLPKPTGGNYWNDANLTDNDNDGFADNPYIFTGGQDNFPYTTQDGWVNGEEDTTTPVTTITLSGIEGNNDWYVSDVEVTLTATDEDSGVASTEYSFDNTNWNTYSTPFTISDEGTKTVYYRSTDNAENVETVKIETVKIDKTAPSITGSKTTEPNANGWNNTDVLVTFTCDDLVSGIEACTPYGIFTNEGAGQSVTGTATDKAGNTTSTTVTNINIDKTKPIISYTQTPPANTNGWNNIDVTVNFTCTDTTSGIDTCLGDTTLTTETTGQTVTGTATDQAGNTATITTDEIKIDKTAPTIVGSKTPEPNENGWNNTNVTVQFTCTDGLSEIDTCTPNTTLSTEGAGQTVSGTATDKAGNTASTTTETNIDKTPPSITISNPTAQGRYPVGMALDFSANDLLSGALQPIGKLTDSDGETVQVNSGFEPEPGVYTLVVEATDQAGNTAESDPVNFVVYDPKRGFAIGVGLFHPDEESSLPSNGRATFGFVARYKKGDFAGRLRFHFKEADIKPKSGRLYFKKASIRLKSKTIDWLVISGTSTEFQGTGTINGKGLYTFRVKAEDNGKPRARTDYFDIRIWEGTDTEADPIYSAKNTLKGGNIVIPKKSRKK